jgi:hypothetical protein
LALKCRLNFLLGLGSPLFQKVALHLRLGLLEITLFLAIPVENRNNNQDD